MTPEKQIILDFLNHYLPILTLVGLIFLIIFYIRFFLSYKKDKKPFCIRFLKENVLLIAFFITLFASTISLIYSDYLGEAPCGLCWLQRVFIFSQLAIFTIAYIKNDVKIFAYTLWLSIIGSSIALYHEFLQLGYSELIPCPTTPGFVDCAKPTFVEYGFITFPFMSLVLFLFLILLALIVNKKSN